MRITHKICCPNCGDRADRDYLTNQQEIRTSCPSCDYLMVKCSQTGKVIEAYAPGIAWQAPATSSYEKLSVVRKQHQLLSHASSAR